MRAIREENKRRTVRNNCDGVRCCHVCSKYAVNKAYHLTSHSVAYMLLLQHTKLTIFHMKKGIAEYITFSMFTRGAK